MGQPAAKQGDQVVATDTHIVMIPSPGGPVPTPLPHPFAGMLDGSLSSDVNIGGKPAAVAGHDRDEHAVARPAGRAVPEAAVEQGDDPARQRDRAHQRQGGRPQRRHRADVQRPGRPAGRPVVAVGTVLIGG